MKWVTIQRQYQQHKMIVIIYFIFEIKCCIFVCLFVNFQQWHHVIPLKSAKILLLLPTQHSKKHSRFNKHKQVSDSLITHAFFIRQIQLIWFFSIVTLIKKTPSTSCQNLQSTSKILNIESSYSSASKKSTFDLVTETMDADNIEESGEPEEESGSKGHHKRAHWK